MENEIAFNELQDQLEQNEFTKLSELASTPFWFFKARWELTAQIKSIQSILKVCKHLRKSYNLPH